MANSLKRPSASKAYPFQWPTDLPSEDGLNMESAWHRDQMNLLIDSIEAHWAGRKDFYCGGNMFLYYSERLARNEDFRGPDFFVAQGVEHDRERPYWAVWIEEAVPDVIVELMSPTTKAIDLGEKKDVYERKLRIPEYFCYDPEDRSLQGWRLDRKYVPIKFEKNGRVWSESLQLCIGPWDGLFQQRDGHWLRFFTKGGKLVRTAAETAEARAAQAVARADQAVARADQAVARADQAEAALESAQAEIARLRQKYGNGNGRNGKHK